MSALVVEDDAKDVLTACSILHSSGFDGEAIVTFASSYKAQRFLQNCLAGEMVLPDLLIIDLDLQHESGYELIRYWRTTPTLTKIPLIVWTILGDNHQQICEAFKISRFVPKWIGREGLQQAITELLVLTAEA